jgi:hypothetical protein
LVWQVRRSSSLTGRHPSLEGDIATRAHGQTSADQHQHFLSCHSVGTSFSPSSVPAALATGVPAQCAAPVVPPRPSLGRGMMSPPDASSSDSYPSQDEGKCHDSGGGNDNDNGTTTTTTTNTNNNSNDYDDDDDVDVPILSLLPGVGDPRHGPRLPPPRPKTKRGRGYRNPAKLAKVRAFSVSLGACAPLYALFPPCCPLFVFCRGVS